MAAIELGEIEGVARRRVGGGDGRRVGAGLVDEAGDDGRAAAVDDGVGELRRDDLAAQPVRRDRVGEALAQRERKIALELARRDTGRPAPGSRGARR